MVRTTSSPSSQARSVGHTMTEQRSVRSMAKATALFCVAFLLGALLPGPMERRQDGIIQKLHSFIPNTTTTTNASSLPRIVWLASFPNSGTSYTISLIQTASGQGIATNNGELHLDPNTGLSRPISPSGPYWSTTTTTVNVSSPEHFILTKTHCGGYCQACKPGHYIESPHSFLTHCIESYGVFFDESTKTAIQRTTYYPRDNVAKTIHLIRNPFDNIVSRFHLLQNKWTRRNDTEALEKFTADKEGFRAYCKATQHLTNNRLVDPVALKLLQDVPCHDEVFRLMQWHNLMFITSDNLLQIKSLVIHYEDYETHLNETLETLLEFLALPHTGRDVPVFVPGKTYLDFFTPEERRKMKQGSQWLASPKTWEHIHHYFD